MRKVIFLLSVILLFGSASYANAQLDSNDFHLEDVVFSNYTTTIVKLLAHFYNGSQTSIKVAKFGIYLYDFSNSLIDIRYFTINNIEPNESRPLKLFFECADKNDIDEVVLKFIYIVE